MRAILSLNLTNSCRYINTYVNKCFQCHSFFIFIASSKPKLLRVILLILSLLVLSA